MLLALTALLMLGCSRGAETPAARSERPAVGRGPEIRRPFVVRPGPHGSLLVVDEEAGSLLEVDVHTGDRRMVREREGVRDVSGLWTATAAGLAHRNGRTLPVQATRLAALDDTTLVTLHEGAVSLVDTSTGAARALDGPPIADASDLAVDGGRVLVLQDRPNLILEVDPRTGSRRVHLDLRAASPGPTMSAQAFCALGDGGFLVTDSVTRRVVRVGPGGRSVLLAPEEASGVRVSAVAGVAPLPDGAAAVAVPDGSIVRVGARGDRSVLSGRRLPNGRLEAVPMGLALDGSRILVTDLLRGRILEVSESVTEVRRGLALPVALARSEGRLYVSDRLQGLSADGKTLVPGSPDFDPGSLAVAGDGTVYLTDLRARSLLAWRGGALGLVSGQGRGAGPAWSRPEGLVAGPRLLVADGDLGEILEVDPSTGDRTVRRFGPVAGLRLRPAGLAMLGDLLAVGQEGPGLDEGVPQPGGVVVLGESSRFLPGDLRSPSRLAAKPDGTLIGTDPETLQVFSVDLENRTVRPVRTF